MLGITYLLEVIDLVLRLSSTVHNNTLLCTMVIGSHKIGYHKKMVTGFKLDKFGL